MNGMLGCFNKNYLTIITASLFLSVCYIYEWHNHALHSPLFPEHASQLGYNFYRYGSLTRLYEVAGYQDHGVVGTGNYIDRAPNIKDTIGYGFLLGLLWKITDTRSFYVVIVLQAFLFAISLCFIWQSIFWYYGDPQKALFATFGVLSFLPVVYLSIQPVKDIWAFYALVGVLWSLIGLMKKKISLPMLLIAALFFGLCQWLRPTIFGVLLALLVVGLPLFYWYINVGYDALKRLLKYFFIANICVFWIPWITYNKITFNHYFVGPTGLALLVSFGDFPNKWGVEVSESWVNEHVQKKYPHLGYKDETQEFDDAAKNIFLEYFKEEPFLYFKNLLRRVVGLSYVNMPWTVQFGDFWTYNIYVSKWQAFHQACSIGFLEAVRFCFFFLYVRLFLLMAYVGLCVLMLEREKLLVVLIPLLVVGNCGEIISHIESKYLMQCYGFLGVWVGLFAWRCKNFLSESNMNILLLKKKILW